MTDEELFSLIDQCRSQSGALDVLRVVEGGLPAPTDAVARLRDAIQGWLDAAAIDDAVRDTIEALESASVATDDRALTLLRAMRFATKARAGTRRRERLLQRKR